MSLRCFFGHAFVLDENATVWLGFQIIRTERVCLQCGEREVWRSPLVPFGAASEGQSE